MGAAILSELLTEILIPVAAIIGIGFSLLQWFLVSQVKLIPNRSHGGFNEALIEEEEGHGEHNVVEKCAEIQSAISEGCCC